MESAHDPRFSVNLSQSEGDESIAGDSESVAAEPPRDRFSRGFPEITGLTFDAKSFSPMPNPHVKSTKQLLQISFSLSREATVTMNIIDSNHKVCGKVTFPRMGKGLCQVYWNG